MLKESWKQNLVLIGFAFLLNEYLTTATLIFIAAGLVLVATGKRPNKIVRNVLALAVFASYWIKYGKIIDPEIGLNFLTSIIVLKILEKETVRDRYMIFFGLLLIISAGSLFERTLTYVFFFSLSFLLLIQDFYSYLGRKWKLKDLGLAVFWVLPLTFGLFFFVPRALNPIPFQQNNRAPGEIGYTPDVSISDIESLEMNQSPVFHVSVGKKLRQQDLYWRGNTLSFSDGWNWKEAGQDRDFKVPVREYFTVPGDIEQKFRLFLKPEYFFSLDYPKLISYRNTKIKVDGKLRTISQGRWEGIQRYSVISDPLLDLLDKETERRYLMVPLSRKEKEKISAMFPGNNLDEVVKSIRTYFYEKEFSYSLSPGRIPGLKEFLDRKIGFCSHFASATALILRMKGIPTRLVSGFMGGNYNRYADFYLVSQNDAHVWVEALSDGKWRRLDPTEWIAPDRVLLGGEAFMETVDQGVFGRSSFFRIPGVFQEMKLWFQQWDYLFYQWLEEIDYHTQEAWFSKFNFQRRWVYSAIPALILFFMLLYILILKLKSGKRKDEHSHHELWDHFIRKMEKKGISISRLSINESELVLRNSLEKIDPHVIEIWKDLISYSFGPEDLSRNELLKKIKNL